MRRGPDHRIHRIIHFAAGEVCRMNVRFRGVTDEISSGVDATRTLVFPQDTSPSLTAVLGRFSILSVLKSLQDKVDPWMKLGFSLGRED